jgi:hypothetical protein
VSPFTASEFAYTTVTTSMPKFLVRNHSGKDLSLGIEPCGEVEVLRPNARAEFEHEHPAALEFTVMEDGRANVHIIGGTVVVTANGYQKTIEMKMKENLNPDVAPDFTPDIAVTVRPAVILFPNHLADMESYSACESFWEDAFQNVLLASGDVLTDWEDGGGRILTMGDGTQYDPVSAAKKFGGVSPIVWKISPSSRRAVRLTHTGDEHSAPYLEAKMDRHPWMHHPDLDILSIYTIPSENEVVLIKMMLSIWVLRNTSLEEMEALIDRLYREKTIR